MFNILKTTLLLALITLFFSVSLPIQAKLEPNPMPDPSDDPYGPFITNYFVNSSIAKVGKPVSIAWESFYTDGCSLMVNQVGTQFAPVSTSSSGSTTVTPVVASTMSVTLSCVGYNGAVISKTRSFNVNQFDHPELIELNLSTQSAVTGSLVTLNWTSEYSSFCEFSGTNSGILTANGSSDYEVQSGENVFIVKCIGADGRVSNTKVVNVTGDVIGQAGVGPFINYLDIDYLGSSPNYLVLWSANADSCMLDGLAVNIVNNLSFPKMANPVPHNLTCFKNGFSPKTESVWFFP